MEFMDYFLNDGFTPFILSTICTVIVALKMYFKGHVCPTNEQIVDKIVVITGASSGVGLETAKQLAIRGAHIILTCRDMEKGKQALGEIKKLVPKANPDLRKLDVSVLGNVQDFIRELQKMYIKVDVLINNAGIMFHPHQRTAEGFDITVATNYLGHFLLTHLMLPLLSQSDNGRIINVTSGSHLGAQIDTDFDETTDPKQAYYQSKLALVMFSNWLATLLKSSDVIVNSVNPGLVRNTNHYKFTVIERNSVVKIIARPFMWLLMKSPFYGAQSIVYLAVDATISNESGQYFNDCFKETPSNFATNPKLCKKIYTKTCTVCNLDSQLILSSLIKKKFNAVQ